MSYNFQDLLVAYSVLGVKKGSVVHVTGDLMLLMKYEVPGKETVLEAHRDALFELTGGEGTLVVPAHSFYLCNTDKSFDVDKTHGMNGVLPESIRQLPEALRSFHPFASYAAIGPRAEEICNDISHHGYGPETPMARLIEMNALSIHIGLLPRMSSSIVHHVEMQMGVPYRYSKEFVHPVVRRNKINKEPFYLYVHYKECDIKRDRNVKIFNDYEEEHTVNQVKVGRGFIYSYSMKDFYYSMVNTLRKDIYSWLNTPPEVRPYQK